MFEFEFFSYKPILMSFGRMVQMDKSKAKLDSWKNPSKVKVTKVKKLSQNGRF